MTVLQSYTLRIVHLRSARIASPMFAMVSGVLLIDGHLECSLSSKTDVRLSLKHLYHKKVVLWFKVLSPKASCSI